MASFGAGVFLALLAVAVFVLVSRRRRSPEPLPSAGSESAADLQRALELREAVFHCITDGVTVLDADGRLALVNAAAARLIGFSSPDELVGRNAADLVSRFHVMDEQQQPLPADRLPSRRAFERGQTTEALLCYQVRATGESRWSMVKATPLLDGAGAVRTVVNVFQDVTDRRRSLDRLEFLAETGAVLGSSLDHNATLAAVARLAVPRFADWCAVHLVGPDGAIEPLVVAHRDPEKTRWARELQRRYPVRADAAQGVAAVLRSGRPELVREITDEMLEAGARDAEELALLREVGLRSFICVPLDARGETVGALTLVTAESHRHYDENDLATAELLGRRAGLAIENARLFREAREANRLKDEFLATLSHELRTPLNAIVGWAHLLREGITDAALIERAALSIHRNAQAQTQLVSDLLDVSRITSGRLRLSVGAVDLGRVVLAALDTMRPAAEAKRIELQPVVDPQAGEISGDADRLQQVVWNLLSNAVKFAPKDGRVHVRVEAVNSHVEIVVEDNGPGIDPEFLPFVFDRFRQQDASSTRVHQGLGLGLAIVRHLVEMHGGTVTATNKDQRTGAVFTVCLPRRSVAVDPDAPRLRRSPNAAGDVSLAGVPDLAGVRVMVVDDHEESRELVRVVLERQGATVVAAASAAQAMDLLSASPPAVLLADIEMPGEDGYSLIQRVRALPPEQGGSLPAVALTAYASSQDRVNALLAGYSAHLAKPVPAAELVAVVARLASLGRGR